MQLVELKSDIFAYLLSSPEGLDKLCIDILYDKKKSSITWIIFEQGKKVEFKNHLCDPQKKKVHLNRNMRAKWSSVDKGKARQVSRGAVSH